MSISTVQGQRLEITVIACNKLKNTEWFSRQDPYVCLEYGNTKYTTKTCTDGGRDPVFQQKFVFTLIEGLRELNVVVWNSNTLSLDDFIGNGRVQLQQALSQGYDDTCWAIQTRSGRHAGEVRLIMHYSNANKPSPSPPHCATHPFPVSAPYGPANPTCPPPYTPYIYHPHAAAYPPPHHSLYPPPHHSLYPSPHHSLYPPPHHSHYPPPPTTCPPSPQPSYSCPPGCFHGLHRPSPY